MAILVAACGLLCYWGIKATSDKPLKFAKARSRFNKWITHIRLSARRVCTAKKISGGGSGISALLAVVLVGGCLFPGSLQLARGEESGDAPNDGSSAGLSDSISTSTTITVGSDDGTPLPTKDAEQTHMVTLDEYLQREGSGPSGIEDRSLEDSAIDGSVMSTEEVAELYAGAASSLKPGDPAYYKQRWQECVDGFSWKDTGLSEWNGGDAGTAPTEGVGTPEDPYKVYTPEQFRWVLKNQKSCVLMNDLDLGGRTGRNWTGISYTTAATIDGGGHTVYNLYSFASQRAGLIEWAGADNYGFEIRDLTISNAQVHVSVKWAAPLVAGMDGGIIDRCAVVDSLAWQDDASTAAPPLIAGVVTFGWGSKTSASLCGDSRWKGYPTKVLNTYARNVDVMGKACTSGFTEVPYNALIENCAAIDGTVVEPGGHSGGFTSCDYGPVTYRNCFTNNDVYGNTQTGVFVGVTHSDDHVFDNCYAAGKIEGSDTIGGFASCSQGASSNVFKNCYSTSMVGMSDGGVNMGGFIGVVGSGSTVFSFENCYAAGEVGSLKSNDAGQALKWDSASGSWTVVSSVGGFAGAVSTSSGYSFSNCYYDKQTTGSKENAIGTTKDSAVVGLSGMLTKSLTQVNLGGSFTVKNGTYPQLNVFLSGQAPSWGGDQVLADTAKAYSQASASTVFLFPSMYDDSSYDPNESDYDTVRRIRYAFPLTNDTMIGDVDIDTAWWYYDDGNRFPNESPLNKDVKIITLSTETNDTTMNDISVTSVATGVGWLRVESAVKGFVGSRNLRLVPTTSVAVSKDGRAIVGSDATVYYQDTDNPPSGDLAYKMLDDKLTKSDHRDGITFVTASAVNLDAYMNDTTAYPTEEDKFKAHNIVAIDFGSLADDKISSEYVEDEYGKRTYLDYTVTLKNSLGHDEKQIARLSVSKVTPAADPDAPGILSSPLLWNDDLKSLFEGSRSPRQDEIGKYVLSYQWLDAGKRFVQAEGTKYLTVVAPLSLVYNLGYVPAGAATGLYFTDPGAYQNTQTINQRAAEGFADQAKLPVDPTRFGYGFNGWAYSRDTSKKFDADAPIEAVTDSQGNTNTAISLLAMWTANPHNIIIKEAKGGSTKETVPSAYDKNILSALAGKESLFNDSLKAGQEFLGWRVEAGLGDARIGTYVSSTDAVPDNDVIVYPSFGTVVSAGMSVYNETQGDIGGHVTNRVGDTVSYSISIKNSSPGLTWHNAKITDELPRGIDIVPGSIALAKKGGEAVTLDDAVYDSSQGSNGAIVHTVESPIETDEEYVLTFKAIINNDAPYVPGGDGTGIQNSATVEGTDPDGNDVAAQTDPVNLPGSGYVSFAPAEKWVTKGAENLTDPSASTAQVGDIVRYTIELGNSSNDSNSRWENAWFYDKIPEGLAVEASTITMTHPSEDNVQGTHEHIVPASYNPDTREISVSAGVLKAGEKATLTFSVIVSADAVGQSVKNTAWAVTDGKDKPTNPPDEPGDIDKTPKPDPDNPDPDSPDPGPTDPVGPGGEGKSQLSVAKSTNVTEASPGSIIPYTITVSNAGDAHAKDIVVTDELPEGLSYVSSVPAAQVSGQTVSWTLTVPAGMSVTRTVMARVTGDVGATIENGVTVTDPADPDNPVNPPVNPPIEVVPGSDKPDVHIAKTSSADTAITGSQLTYALFVSNSGSADAKNVVVTDQLPAGTLFISASNGGTYRNGVALWTVDVPAGQTKQINLTVKVQSKTGTLVNMATAAHGGSADVSDPVQTSVSQAPVVEDKPRLSVTKTTDATSVAKGSQIPYTITVTNSGKGDAKNIEIVDALPEGLAYVSSSPDATKVEGNTVSWTVDIASGQTVERTLTVEVMGDVGSSIENGVSVTNPDGGDPIVPPDKPSIDVTDPDDSKDVVDLSIAKAADADSAQFGDAVTYTITVYNKGGKEASDVTVSDALPAGLSFTSGDAGVTAANGVVSWKGSVPAQGNASFRFVAEVTAKNATLVNTAVAEYEGSRVSSKPITVAVATEPAGGDKKPKLAVTKTTSATSSSPGSLIPYTITVSNTGDGDAADVPIVDTLPSGLEYVSSTPAGTYDKDAHTVTWNLDVAAGGQVVCVITARVAETAAGAIENSVEVTDPGDPDNPVTPPDKPSVDVTDPDPDEEASVSLAKSASASTVVPGGQITYTLTLTNTGQADASGVAVADALPAGSSFVMASDGATCENNTVHWIVDVPAGEQKELTFTVNAPSSSGSMLNTAQAQLGDETVKSDTVTTAVKEETTGGTGKAELSVSKFTSVSQAVPGSVVPYTITVSNTGDADATDVEIVDELPAGLTYVSSNPAGKVEGNKVTWKATVKAGGSVTRIISARVTGAAGQSIANSVTVVDPTDPDNPVVPPTDPTIDIPEQGTVTGVLTVDTGTAATGDIIRYTLTVTNATKTDATGVQAVHKLPAGVSFKTASDEGSYTPDGAAASMAMLDAEAADEAENDAGTVTWTMDVPAGASVSRVVSAKVTAQSGTLVSTADLIHGGKTIAANPVSTVVPVDGSASGTPKISVSKTTTVSQAAPGSQIPYTITVRNTGDGKASNLVVSDKLPDSLTYVSSSAGGSYDGGSHEVSWTIPALDAGQTITRTIIAQVDDDAMGSIENSVEVIDPANPDTPIAPPSIPDTPVVDPADEAKPLLGIAKSASADAVKYNDEITYTVTVSNTGTADAKGVAVTDALPKGLEFVEAADGGACAEGAVSWTVDVPAGKTVERTFKAKVTSKSGTLSNIARAAYNGATVSSDPVSTPVSSDPSGGAGAPDMSVTKTTPVAQAAQGSEIPYIVTVTNTGDGDALGYRIVDVLPEGLTYVSSTPAATVHGQEVVWTVDVPKGSSVTRTLIAKVTGEIGSTVKNSVTVTDPDGNGGVTPPVDPPVDVTDPEKRADMHISKSAKTDSAPAGGRLVYLITLTNTGDGDATGVAVSDKLPMNTSFMEASDGGTYDQKTNKVLWSVDVAAGQTKQITLAVKVEALSGTLVNVATETYDGKSESSIPAIATSVTDEITEADPEASVSKTVRNVTAETEGRDGADDMATWRDGDVLEYAIVAANAKANSTWREVVLSDVLPDGLELVAEEPIRYTAPGAADASELEGAYDEGSHAIRVETGDISGGQQASLSYRARISAGDDYSVDAQLRNRVQAAGYVPDGGTEVIEESTVSVPTPEPLAVKELTKRAVNLTDPSGDVVQVGDRIRYTVTATNREPNSRSIWKNAYVYDRVPEGLDVDAATLKLVASDGRTYSVSDCFDPETREIVVSTGPIFGGSAATVEFEATIPLSAVGQDIANVALVGTLESVDPTVPEQPGKPGIDSVPNPAEPAPDDDPINPNPGPTDPVVPNGDGSVLLADPDPSIDKVVADLDGDGSYDNGDEVLYTVTVANNRTGSVWYGVEVTDTIPLGLKLDVRSIRFAGPDKVFSDVASTCYDEATRKLVVPIGDVYGGETYVLSYACTLDFSLGTGDVVNHVVAVGGEPGGSDNDPSVEGGASIAKPLVPWNPTALARSGDMNGNLVSLIALVALLAGGLATGATRASRNRMRTRDAKR